jgi:hypothetical protein
VSAVFHSVASLLTACSIACVGLTVNLLDSHSFVSLPDTRTEKNRPCRSEGKKFQKNLVCPVSHRLEGAEKLNNNNKFSQVPKNENLCLCSSVLAGRVSHCSSRFLVS